MVLSLAFKYDRHDGFDDRDPYENEYWSCRSDPCVCETEEKTIDRLWRDGICISSLYADDRDDEEADYDEWVMNNKLSVLDAQDALIAQDRLEDGQYALRFYSDMGSWKRTNKNARKQWVRHPKRVLRNVKPLDRFEVERIETDVRKRRENAHFDLMSKLVRDNYQHLTKRGDMIRVRIAYDAARRDVEDLQKENDEKLAARGPTVYHVRQEYDSMRYRRYDDCGDLLYFQDLYEPHNLEDLGHEGVWNPPLPKGFNVITDESFDYWMECFRTDAYEDDERDHAEMHVLRDTEGFQRDRAT